MDQINPLPPDSTNFYPEKPKGGAKSKIILLLLLALLIIGAVIWYWQATKTGKTISWEGGFPVLSDSSDLESGDKDTVASVSVPEGVEFETYQSVETGVTLQKPKGWTADVTDGVIYVKEDSQGLTETIFTLINNVSNKINAVGLADAVIKKTRETYPDFDFTAKVSENKGIVELAATYTNKAGGAHRGTYLITLENGDGFFGGYEAPSNEFDQKQPTLDYILSSLKLSAPQTVSGSDSNETPVDPNESITLIAQTVNSASISVPSDWTVTGLGLPGNIIAANADGTYGYIGSTVCIYPPGWESLSAEGGCPVSEYQGPQGFLANVYLPALNNSNISVLGSVDASSILEGAEGAEAEVVLLSFSNSNGQSLKGAILALTISPSIVTGQWSALVYGFWLPEADFESKYTLMTRISASYTPDEQTIRDVTAEKLKSYQEGIQRLSQSLSKQLADSYKSTAGATSSSGGETRADIEERMYQKWNDYATGEERMYSDVEDKVYTLPAGYDRYYNPQYPSEQLTPISNDQWGIEVDRSYLPGGWRYGL